MVDVEARRIPLDVLIHFVNVVHGEKDRSRTHIGGIDQSEPPFRAARLRQILQ